ncbi:Mobile element protein [Candidatus Enterovibrio escicola]|uniref:Mobile element protein n=1 Tax=Candidatus Enterovibrio escicola TaxID=1927127 RepID=A0A2A5T0R2_9GAMM|nr:Mobile element protein [Candidatus Enterovibrio escacola]
MSIHQVISAKVSLISVGDNEVLPTLLNPLRRKRQQVNVDGVSNTKACHLLLKNKGISPSIPPQSNSEYWKERHPRNEAVKELKEDKLAEWKKDRGYHKLSLAEIAMFRYKQLLNHKLTLRDDNDQVSETLASVKEMDSVIRLGVPVYQQTN